MYRQKIRYGLVRCMLKTRSRGYHWGNYDASSGECCQMRDAETTKCVSGKTVCGATPRPNKCYKWTPGSSDEIATDDYGLQIRKINHARLGVPECSLVRHDEMYKPSDKNRRYQRTWPECPHIWLRPKKVCCYEREYYPPIVRRELSRSTGSLSAIEKHLYAMKLLCVSNMTAPGCRPARSPPRCDRRKRPLVCKKTPAPFPSFSECEHEDLPTARCPDECACRVFPSMCEVWQDYHRNHGRLKRCSDALVGYCPFKPKSKPSF